MQPSPLFSWLSIVALLISSTSAIPLLSQSSYLMPALQRLASSPSKGMLSTEAGNNEGHPIVSRPDVTVSLSFTDNYDVLPREHTIEMPLHYRLTARAGLPQHPITARINAVSYASSSAAEEIREYGAASSIICFAHPVHRLDDNSKAPGTIDPNSRPAKDPVWFTMADGQVHFQEVGEHWSLGGREVESWECI